MEKFLILLPRREIGAGGRALLYSIDPWNRGIVGSLGLCIPSLPGRRLM
jgi:hypothetical protein